MAKIKTGELIDAALDWAVATCEGYDTAFTSAGDVIILREGVTDYFDPHRNWGWGGPIIEREMLCVGYRHQADPNYCPINDPATICWSRTTAGGYPSYGPTPLIAAMRCFCCSKLGDTVEVPEELTCSPTPKND